MRTYKSVADVMTRDVVSVRTTTPYKDIVRTLASRGVSAAPVVDHKGRVLGVVSESDLLRKEEYHLAYPPRWWDRRGRAAAKKADGTWAEDLMTTPAVTVLSWVTLPGAAKRMSEAGATRLVVVDRDDKMVGIVSRSDLLSVFLASDEEILSVVRHNVTEYVLWDDPYAIEVSVYKGIVTLKGQLDRKSMIPIAVQLTRTIDGVVDVVNHLSFAYDDTGATSPNRFIP